MTDLAALTARRKRLLASGYTPIPANGKAVHLAGWPSLQATEADIEAWARERPGDTNTGLFTARTPAVDIDVLDPEVAAELHREFLAMIGNGGCVIVVRGLGEDEASATLVSGLEAGMAKERAARISNSLRMACVGARISRAGIESHGNRQRAGRRRSPIQRRRAWPTPNLSCT
jgi:hypothetical protein